jgi:hypothetical protein
MGMTWPVRKRGSSPTNVGNRQDVNKPITCKFLLAAVMGIGLVPSLHRYPHFWEKNRKREPADVERKSIDDEPSLPPRAQARGSVVCHWRHVGGMLNYSLAFRL